jgi:FkbM family methyltransferase
VNSVKKLSARALAAVTRPLLGLLRGYQCDLAREEIRNVRFSFSQYGEDLAVLRWAEATNPPKVYVDAGCFDPSLCSNTLLLHKAGWRGVNIDLDPVKIDRFREARPADHNVVAALSDVAATMRVFHYPEPTTDCVRDVVDSEVSSVIGQSPVSSESVSTTTLNSVLKQCPFVSSEIGYLNIDCEGHDLRVLKGCDLDLFRPCIITIEALDNDCGEETKAHLQSNGYELKEIIFRTLLFVRRDVLVSSGNGRA